MDQYFDSRQVVHKKGCAKANEPGQCPAEGYEAVLHFRRHSFCATAEALSADRKRGELGELILQRPRGSVALGIWNYCADDQLADILRKLGELSSWGRSALRGSQFLGSTAEQPRREHDPGSVEHLVAARGDDIDCRWQ